MSDETLKSVANVLRGCLEEGMDPEGVRFLLEMLESAPKSRSRGEKTAVVRTVKTMTRAECVEPGCEWRDTPVCRRTGEHRFEKRTYALVDDDD